ncbi:MAG TPA: hypothetical protein DDX92_14125 [Flavobacteriales bacterium]|nr:hypothetical protein [Flavobacteriales bacterium]
MNNDHDHIDELAQNSFSEESFEMSEKDWAFTRDFIKSREGSNRFSIPRYGLGTLAIFILGVIGFFMITGTENQDQSSIQSTSSNEMSKQDSDPDSFGSSAQTAIYKQTPQTVNKQGTADKNKISASSLNISSSSNHENDQTIQYKTEQRENLLNGTNTADSFIHDISAKSLDNGKTDDHISNAVLITSRAVASNSTGNSKVVPSAEYQKSSTDVSTKGKQISVNENFAEDLKSHDLNINSKNYNRSTFINSSRGEMGLPIILPPKGFSENHTEDELKIIIAPSESVKLKSQRPITIKLGVGYMTYIEEYQEEQPDLKRIESAAELNVDLELEVQVYKQFGIQTGLSINQVQLQNLYSWTSQGIDEYWKYDTTTVFILDSTWWLGDWWFYDPYPEDIIDSTIAERVFNIDNSERTKSRLTYLEVPLQVTFSHYFGRWKIQGATGLSAGFLIGSSGNGFSNESKQVEALQSTNVNAVTFHYLLNAEVGYFVSPRWYVFARPQTKVILNSSYTADYTAKRRPILIGGSFGVAFDL